LVLCQLKSHPLVLLSHAWYRCVAGHARPISFRIRATGVSPHDSHFRHVNHFYLCYVNWSSVRFIKLSFRQRVCPP
jgi:hypothetical protein